MDLNDVLLVVATMATLVNGYSSRKRYMSGVMISMLVAQAQLFIKINDTGTSDYVQTITNASSQSWVVGIAYVFIVWWIGYILGGITIKMKVNNDELLGKDVESDVYRLD
jgi:hypothetical protein